MSEPRVPGTIVLVGAPGAGKTTTGRRIAQHLGVDFVDVDQLIEAEQGCEISEIFLMKGEPYFRELEREATLRSIGRPGVVSLGGGAVTNQAVREALAGHEVVWLQVSAAQATRRVGLTGNGRPLLAGGVHSTMVRLMNERRPLYEAVATVGVETDNKRPGAVAREVLVAFGIDVPHQSEGEEQ